MSGSKGGKRISVFDRLGPGNDEQPSTSHRRYSSEKHVTTSANQEKARTHVYGPPVPQDQPIRDRKSRGKHGGEASEEDATSTSTSSRRGNRSKEKHPERPASSSSSSSASRHRSPPPPPPSLPPPLGADTSTNKSQRSRRGEGMADHKRRGKEEEPLPKTSSELGHKRKRDHLEESGHPPDLKRPRHGDSRDTERHHSSSSGKETSAAENLDKKSDVASGKKHRSRSPKTPVPATSVGGGDRGRGASGKKRDSARKPGEREQGRAGEAATSAKKSKGLDWTAVNSFTEKANAKLNYQCPRRSVMEQFTPGAVLMGVEVSPTLAGDELFQSVLELVKTQSKLVEGEEGSLSNYWADILEGSEPVATPRTPLKSALYWDRTLSRSLGACRRALTASGDYTLRRLLRKEQHRSYVGAVRSPTCTNSWAAGHYEIAVDFYNTLPTKLSGKSAHRLQTSKVGTLML